jgi:general stress protein 26
MDEAIRAKILELLDQHRLTTIATNRPDGWPQATTVGYANDGLTIYFLCGPQSQKAQNIARDNRVSLTIDHDVSDPMAITGLSMAAIAEPLRASRLGNLSRVHWSRDRLYFNVCAQWLTNCREPPTLSAGTAATEWILVAGFRCAALVKGLITKEPWISLILAG